MSARDAHECAARLDAVLASAVESGALVGASAAAWSADGLEYAGAAGQRAPGEPMGADTVVWIASMTKAITGAAVMQLVERGVLALDQPAGELVPYLDQVQVLDGFDADGTARLRPPARRLTIRHLLTHTSGFSYEFADASLAKFLTANPRGALGTQASYEQPLLFDPGERWAYGIGIDWAGRVVEAAAGQRLDQHLRDHLLGPLGMSDTGFSRSSGQLARAADVHLRTPDALVPIPFALPDDPEMLMGGGGLYSTVVDYLRFARMILGGGSLEGVRVLSPETVATMCQSHIGDLVASGWQTQTPMMSNDVSLFPGERAGWGLTFLVNPHRTAEGRSPGSVAWAGLANSYYWIDRTAGVAGVFATQVLPFFDDGARATFAAFERAVYDSLT